jgi:hypothetical protein
MTKPLPDTLTDFDAGKQSLDLAQRVENVLSAKRALVKTPNGDTAELFKAIDKLGEFYKTK